MGPAALYHGRRKSKKNNLWFIEVDQGRLDFMKCGELLLLDQHRADSEGT